MKTDPLLSVPRFARLTDFLGLWAIEPGHAATLATLFGRIDLASHVAASVARPQPVTSAMEFAPGKGDKRTAVIRAAGTLMKSQSSMGGTSTIQLRRDVRAAAADPNVSGILLAIDSPGGTVAGTADLAADIRAARRRKPVWSHIDDLGASAAYWLASQADQVFANHATAKVGNVGTVAAVTDVSGAAEKDGVKVHVFATGPMKAAGWPGTKLTDEQTAYLQALVDESQSHFDAAVKAGRGLNAEQLKEVRSGAIYPAARAKDLKLIDGIRPLEETLAALAAAG